MPKLEVFSGIAPKINPRLLPPGKAQAAVNVRMTSGKIEPFKAPLDAVTPIKVNPLSIFKVVASGVDKWLTWNRDVDVVPSPVIGETLGRLYFSGDAEPRVTTTALATSGPDMPTSSYVLGVPRPVTAPTVTPTGGSGTQETRAYVYTFVDPWGQEGQPSAGTSATGYANATSWNLSGMDTTPNSGGTVTAVSSSGGVTTFTMPAGDTKFLRVGEEVTFAGIHSTINGKQILTAVTATTVTATTMSTYTSAVTGTWSRVAPFVAGSWKQRIYRSDTAGNLRFVAEQAIGATYSDTISNANLSSSVLESTDYAMPPPGLTGFVITPSGTIAGMLGNDIYLSEPNKPWAWPSAYIRPIPYTPVGLGVFNGTIVVATKGIPYALSGYHPENIQPVQAGAFLAPCSSKRSVVSTSMGVVWDTEFGLVITPGTGTTRATEALFTEKEWTPYRVTFGASYKDAYLGWNESRGFYLNLTTGDFCELSLVPVAAKQDTLTGRLFIVHNSKIRQWDAAADAYLAFDWTSGIFVSPMPTNYGAARVDADYLSLTDAGAAAAAAADDAAWNAAILAGAEGWPNKESKTKGCIDEWMFGETPIGGSDLREFSYEYSARNLSIRIYAGGDLVRTKALTDAQSFKSKGGFKASEWYARLSGNIRVDKVEIAETAERLRRL